MAGILPSGRPQNVEEALAATNDFINRSIVSGDFAGAIHAAQDLATPGHAGQLWEGFSASHVLGDMFPSLSTINQAYQSTKNVLK